MLFLFLQSSDGDSTNDESIMSSLSKNNKKHKKRHYSCQPHCVRFPSFFRAYSAPPRSSYNRFHFHQKNWSQKKRHWLGLPDSYLFNLSKDCSFHHKTLLLQDHTQLPELYMVYEQFFLSKQVSFIFPKCFNFYLQSSI
jgi:hypothetical protein